MTEQRFPSYAGAERTATRAYYPPTPRFQQAPPQFGPRPASPGAPSYGEPSHAGAPKRYAGWWLRAIATIVDGVIGISVIAGLLAGAMWIMAKNSMLDPLTTDVADPGGRTAYAILGAAALMGLFFTFWNQVSRQGRTGQTLGKSVVRIQLVSAGTGKFIGAGNTFARAVIAAIFGPLSFIDYLWPVWDGRKQTLHDKAVGTVVTRK